MQSSESLTEVETTHIEVAKERRLVHYILEGESGVIDVGGRHVIFVDELQREINREHLSEEEIVTKTMSTNLQFPQCPIS